MTPLQKIESLIAKGNAENALEQLLELVSRYKSIHKNDVLSLSSRYQSWKNNKLITDSDKVEERNRIVHAILEISNKVYGEEEFAVQYPRTKFEIIINAKFDKNDKEKINEILYGLMEITTDYSIKLLGTDDGSIILKLEGTSIGYKTLERLIISSKFKLMGKYEIITVKEINVESQKDIYEQSIEDKSSQYYFMKIKGFKKNLKDLLIKNTPQAIDRLFEIVKSTSKYYNQLVLIKSQLSDNISIRSIRTEGRSELNQDLNNIRSSFLGIVDSLTSEDFVENLDYSTFKVKVEFNLIHEQEDFKPTIKWEDYGKQISKLTKTLNHLKSNHYYKPNIIIGISNGGCVVSDIIGSTSYKGYSIPVISLWSNRWQNIEMENRNYFDNIYNNNLIDALVEGTTDEKISILLIDDVVRSAKTYFQAKNYLYDKISSKKELEILFLPLFIVKKEYLDDAHNELVFGFRDGEFDTISKETYFKAFCTNQKLMPWGKKLTLGKHSLEFD